MARARIVPCPKCRRIDCVNRVHTVTSESSNIITARFCKECLVEFRIDGSIIPPVQIEKDLSGVESFKV